MNRYLPITGIDCAVPALQIDTQAPLDVLHATATHRIRTATQWLEHLAHEEGPHSDLARALVVGLRDGCDVLDVMGWRLRSGQQT